MLDNDEKSENTIVCRVVLLGGVQKTGIITKFCSIDSNPGSTFQSKTVFFSEENKYIKFDIWDTAGAERYRNVTRIFYRNTDVFILIYNITNYNSFAELKEYWINDIKKNANKEFSKKK